MRALGDAFAQHVSAATRSLRLVLSALLFAGLLAGCDEGSRSAHGRLPLAGLALPPLHCTAPAEQLGDCRRDRDCGEAERCVLAEITPVDRAPPTLRCSPPVGLLVDRDRCMGGQECESGLCGLAGVCLRPCVASEDCLRGQSCQPVEVRIAEGMLSPVQACARVAAFAEDVELRVQSGETLVAGTLNRLPLDLSGRDAMAFLKVDCGARLRLLQLEEARTGRVLFDIAAQLNGQAQINPVFNTGSLLPVLLPNNPRLTLDPAGYELGLTIDATSEVDVVTAVAPARERNVLDLNIFYVGGGSVEGDDGLRPGAASFLAVIAKLGERYAEIGIELGAVREYDVVGALRSELGSLRVVAVSDEAGNVVDHEVEKLDVLFQLSAGVDDGGLNLFVLREMGPVLGISGGLPGALGLQGTAASGVAIALDTVGLADADRVLFHEMAHQLGLFHTSESDGVGFSPLSDTLVCGPDQDRDGDGTLRGDECGAHGADNLMFWEGQGDALSPQQVELLRRSLVLR